MGFFLLSIKRSVEELLRGDLGASGDVVTPNGCVVDVYTFKSLPQLAVAICDPESHACECASTSSERYIWARDTLPSSFASRFSKWIATTPTLQKEQGGDTPALLWTSFLKEWVDSWILALNFLAICTNGAKEVCAGWCSEAPLVWYKLHMV